jgi:hypothetical protein
MRDQESFQRSGGMRFFEVFADGVQELVAEAVLTDRVGERGAGRGGRIREVFGQEGVLRAEGVFVDVAVLDDERGDQLRSLDRQAQADL